MKAILYLLIFIPFCSCKHFLYHPDEIRPNERHLNTINLDKLRSNPHKSTLKFILIGDTQRFYDELDAFIDNVNSQRDISFVLLDGDLVDFGLNREYNWIAGKLNRLNIPYIAIIGNHDMLANGRKIFNEMFGPDNFSFILEGNKFICYNSNSRETGFDGSLPDMSWLSQQLSDSTSTNIFTVCHVPPFSTDFDRNIEKDYAKLLSSNKKVRLSLNAHLHQYEISEPYDDGLTYLVSGAGNQRCYSLITVNGESYVIEKKFY